jgi:hypothetical protein
VGYRQPLETIPGRTSFPLSSVIGTPPLAPQYATLPWSPQAIFVGAQPVTLPAVGASSGGSVSGTISLPTLPQSLSLRPSDSAIIFGALSLGQQPSDVLVGLPYLSLIFGNGSPLNAGGVGTATFALQSGRVYTSPQLAFTLTCLSTTGASVGSQSVMLNVTAIIFGYTASGGQ